MTKDIDKEKKKERIIKYDVDEDTNNKFLDIIEKLRKMDFEDKKYVIDILDNFKSKSKSKGIKTNTINNFTIEKTTTKEYKHIYNKLKKDGIELQDFEPNEKASLLKSAKLLRLYIEKNNLKNGQKTKFIPLDKFLIDMLNKAKVKDGKKSINEIFQENNNKYPEENEKYDGQFITQGQIQTISSNYLLK